MAEDTGGSGLPVMGVMSSSSPHFFRDASLVSENKSMKYVKLTLMGLDGLWGNIHRHAGLYVFNVG